MYLYIIDIYRPEKDTQNGTGNRTGRTGRTGEVEDRTTKKRLPNIVPGQGCQNRTARIRQDRKDRTSRKGLPQQDI
jgi:hypothetical protein